MKCSKCREETTLEGFDTYRDRKGLVRRRGICRGCRTARATENFEYLQQWRKNYNAEHRTQRQRESAERRLTNKKYVDEYKSSRPCTDCGRFFPPVAMDLDHVKGKNKPIANMVGQGYKLDLIKKELELCEPVCACCHRIRTAARKQNLAPRKTD